MDFLTDNTVMPEEDQGQEIDMEYMPSTSKYPTDVVPDKEKIMSEERALADSLIKINDSLTPTPEEHTALSALVNLVNTTLKEGIVLNLQNPDRSDIIVQEVGSFKKGTMRNGHNVADVVMILKELPTLETVEEFSKIVEANINRFSLNDARYMTASLSLSINECGFTVHDGFASVRVLVTTQLINFSQLNPDVHLDKKLMSQYLAAVQHITWFENNGQDPTVRILIRVLRDMQNRFTGLADLTPWMIDVLAYFAVMKNCDSSITPLPVGVAFRRAFQLLAADLCSDSNGIGDPCEAHDPVHSTLTLEQRLTCCITAQTIAQVFAFGGYKNVLDFKGKKSISENMSMWGGLLAYPANKAYQEVEAAKDDAVVEVASDVVT